MNKKNKKLNRYKIYLRMRIQEIKNKQNDLMLQTILLSSKIEELELKVNLIEKSIVEENNIALKQTVNTLYNNSLTVLYLN